MREGSQGRKSDAQFLLRTRGCRFSSSSFSLTRLDGTVLMAFHKPYGVLSQFTSDGSPNRTLAEFGFPSRVYPLGRLDADSEGLLLLSDEAGLNDRLLDPRRGHTRTYWAQIERVPAPSALNSLAQGVVIQGRQTLPARVWKLDPQPDVPPRTPPIRFRKNVPDCWIGLELCEGKNRQVRRMTAAIDHPTLRLIRVRIGSYELSNLAAGCWREVDVAGRNRILSDYP
ncbi:MAG: pseudouridine synthase [Pedosphaera sp.]|nr:pseudouridine synthase [Pedosphaera sp.]